MLFKPEKISLGRLYAPDFLFSEFQFFAVLLVPVYNEGSESPEFGFGPRKRRAKCEAASIRCSIPWCTRSDSGAGAARALAGRA